jgi:predicted ArsR family transcriptional regulator
MGQLEARIRTLEGRISRPAALGQRQTAEAELTALLVQQLARLESGEALSADEQQRMQHLRRVIDPNFWERLPEAEKARRLANLRRRWGLAGETAP